MTQQKFRKQFCEEVVGQVHQAAQTAVKQRALGDVRALGHFRHRRDKDEDGGRKRVAALLEQPVLVFRIAAVLPHHLALEVQMRQMRHTDAVAETSMEILDAATELAAAGGFRLCLLLKLRGERAVQLFLNRLGLMRDVAANSRGYRLQLLG
jgi:hypothetical protein